MGFRKPLLASVILFAFTLIVFLPAANGAFQFFDDNAYIIKNSHVNSGLTLKNIRWAFFDFGVANWHPLTWLSYMLDVEIYGLDAWGFHFTNLLFHAANTVFVFLVIRKLTREDFGSLAVAVLFGIHPLHVEPAVWISERKDVLSTFFMLISLWLYDDYARQNKKSFYIGALAAFILGLLCKQMIVTFPFVLLLLDFWPWNRWHQNKWRLIGEKATFFLIAAAASSVAYFAKKDGGALQWMQNLSITDRIENAFVSYVRYLGKFLWPENLCVYYPHPGHWPAIIFGSCGLLIIAISLFAWLKRNQWPFLFVGWFWFVGTLVPVIGLVQLYSLSIADVYMYLPMIGLLLLIAAWIKQFPADIKKMANAIIFLAAIPCIMATAIQINYWKDSETLWTHAAQVTKNNYVAHNNIGIIVMPNQPDAAFFQFQQAVNINPEFADAQRNLGTSLMRNESYGEAIEHFQKSLELEPGSAWTWHMLGVALIKSKNESAAITNLEKAVEIDPHNAEYKNELTVALNNASWEMATGDKRNGKKAVIFSKRACELDGYKQTVFVGTLAAAYAEAGQFSNAVETAKRAIDLAALNGNTNLVQRNRELLALYLNNQPYHEILTNHVATDKNEE